MNGNDFVKRLRIRMAELDMSRAELAEKTGINTNTIHGYFREQRIPRADDCIKIAEALHVSVEYLILGKEADDNPDLEELVQALRQLSLDDLKIVKGIIFAYVYQLDTHTQQPHYN